MRTKKNIFLAIVGAAFILMFLTSEGLGFVPPNDSFNIGQDIGVLAIYIASLSAIKKVIWPKKIMEGELPK